MLDPEMQHVGHNECLQFQASADNPERNASFVHWFLAFSLVKNIKHHEINARHLSCDDSVLYFTQWTGHRDFTWPSTSWNLSTVSSWWNIAESSHSWSLAIISEMLMANNNPFPWPWWHWFYIDFHQIYYQHITILLKSFHELSIQHGSIWQNM